MSSSPLHRLTIGCFRQSDLITLVEAECLKKRNENITKFKKILFTDNRRELNSDLLLISNSLNPRTMLSKPH